MTVIAMVSAKVRQMPIPPGLTRTRPGTGSGKPLGSAKCMARAGTSQFASEGRNSWKKSKNSALCACHTINVVMSPNALQAPPALAATTRLINESVAKRACPPPTASTTADITSAVVRLSSTGEMKKAIARSEEHTSELQSRRDLVCRLLLEKKK